MELTARIRDVAERTITILRRSVLLPITQAAVLVDVLEFKKRYLSPLALANRRPMIEYPENVSAFLSVNGQMLQS